MSIADLHIAASPAELEFAGQVRSAFECATSIAALAEHPLAQTSMIQSALILETTTPSPDERGRALQQVLWWAVERLAPNSTNIPATLTEPIDLGAEWVGYNLLRFHYLQPHALSGGERRLAGLGIAAPEHYYQARSRAFAEVTGWLARQRDQGVGSERIRGLALDNALARFQQDKQLLHLTGIASIFTYPVDRGTLLTLAVAETISAPEQTLDRAIVARALHISDADGTVWMAEPLRAFLAARQPRILQQGRHQLAARSAFESGNVLASALHLYEGGAPQQSAARILEFSSQSADVDEPLARFAARFSQGEVTREQWRALQHLRARQAQASGAPDQALQLLRSLLESGQSAADPAAEQAAIYLQMGQIFSERGGARSEEQALTLFQTGIEKSGLESGGKRAAPTSDSATQVQAELLKELAWIYVKQNRPHEADLALQRALSLLSSNERTVRADLYDAFSALRRAQGDFRSAIEFAQAALVLREGMGNAMHLGRSYNALGILYRLIEEYENALQAYQRALAIFQQVDNSALVATAMINIGTAYHFTDRLADAERWYRLCLLVTEDAALAVTELRAHANLCEALIGLEREEEARMHWRTAWARSHQIDNQAEIEYLQRVAERYPALVVELEDDSRVRPKVDGAETLALHLVLEPGESGNGAHSLPSKFAKEGPSESTGEHKSLEAMLAVARADRLSDSVKRTAARAQGTDATIDAQSLTLSHRQPYGASVDQDESRLLALLQQIDRLNVATAMEATSASKATATRKLARLVERGLLVRHGQGRATYYTRAHGVPAMVLATDLEGLQNRLDIVALRFAQEYNLVRARVVGVRYGVRANGESELCYEVKASFTRNPILEDFFVLERALGHATSSRIHLTL